MPNKALSLAREWIKIHKSEILEMFNTAVRIAGLSIEWADETDICPDEQYNNSYKRRDKMKNIFILGVQRTGKSTLSKMLIKELKNYSIIKLDAVRNALDDTFPFLEINPRLGKGMEKDFPKFIANLMKWNNRLISNEDNVIYENELGYIIEGDSLFPEDIISVFSDKEAMVLCLGNGDLNETEIFENIRKYETQVDYTYYRSDDRVMESCKRSVAKNKIMKQQCEKYKYPYYDTSKNRKEVLEEIVEQIKKEL